ncbi:MAG: molecular chaperone DjlA [Halomonadaceae bacterium]|nr:MAG: molecular chaperone DjlA [Halomonadaceae bacterium]
MTARRQQTKDHNSDQGQMPLELPELLRLLDASGHHGARLLERSGLPLWSRPQLFRLLGFLSRSDGRVTELDVRYGEALLRALGAGHYQRRYLIRRFHKGKTLLAASCPWWLRLLTRRWPGTTLRLAIALGHACHHEGPPTPARASRYRSASEAMGLSTAASQRILASYTSKVWITQPNSGGDGPPPAISSFSGACQVLGGHSNDSLQSLRQNYRRLRGRYHPDRVLHTGIPEQEARLKLDQLQKAWDIISKRHPDA